MPFIPVPATILAEMIYSTPGGRAENTLYFTYSTTIDAAALTNLGVVLEDWHETWVRPLQPASVSLTSIKLTSLVTDTSPAIEYVTGLPNVGSGGGTILPSNVTAAITFLTLFRGRNNRGRNYIVGLREGDVDNDTIQQGAVDAWIDAYEELLAAAEVADFPWVVVSRYNGVDGNGKPIPRVSGQTTPVIAVKMDNTIDSQRRRLLHRGQ